jgi:hypothetical protein
MLGEPCVDWSKQITRVFLESAAYWTSGLSEAITGSCDSEASTQISVAEWMILAESGSLRCCKFVLHDTIIFRIGRICLRN